jgi:Lon protease-like protein
MALLPLFPLKVVLFPCALLPLHVFEERYKLMIGHCLEAKAPFGVVLIREGEEVGGVAEPCEIGTSARIARVQRLPDGRMNLVAIGGDRFRITALDHSEPYLQGDIELVASECADSPEAQDEAQRVATLFGEQFRLNMAVTAQWVRSVDLPREPDRLADFVAAHLELAPATRQELLETLSVPDRLRRETGLLGDIIRSLTDRWEQQRRERFAGSALN